MIELIVEKLSYLVITAIFIGASTANSQALPKNGNQEASWWRKGYIAPTEIKPRIKSKFEAIITYYSAEVAQTDNNPCITADGTNICDTNERIIAINGLKFDTSVRIDGKIYRVADRMNSRYSSDHVDILVGSREEAIQLGRKFKTVEILE